MACVLYLFEHGSAGRLNAAIAEELAPLYKTMIEEQTFEDHVFDDIKPAISLALAEAARDGVRDAYAMQQVIRRTIGTWVNKAHRRRPMIIPVVIVD